MKTSIKKISDEIFQKIFFLKIGKQQNFHDFYNDISQIFSKFHKLAINNNINTEVFNHAKYAFSAYIDEMVLYSNWPEKTIWAEKTLQATFFSEQLAGEGFFERLDKIQKNNPNNIELIKLYYFCLELGFQGKYRVLEKELLIHFKNKLFEKIEQKHFVEKPKTKTTHTKRKTKPKLSFQTFCTIIFIFMYLIFSLAIHIAVTKNIAEINSNRFYLAENGAIN